MVTSQVWSEAGVFPISHSLSCHHWLDHEEDHPRQTKRHPIELVFSSRGPWFCRRPPYSIHSPFQLAGKTARLKTYTKQAGLHINTAKTQVMYVYATPTAPITANGDPLEFVEEFTYFGSLISKDNGAQKDIKARLGKARGKFARLRCTWKSKQYRLKTKLRSGYVKAMWRLCWCTILIEQTSSSDWANIKSDMSKLESFHNGCLRKICRIFWPNKISKRDRYRKLVGRALLWKANLGESDGWATYREWIRLVSLRLPCAGHHLVKGNLVGQIPPGAELSWLSLVR